MSFPSVKNAKWSTNQADVGEQVTLQASLANIEKQETVQFQISEYSGVPPSQGGGSRLEPIETLSVSVQEEATNAFVKWKLKAVPETSPYGGFPEYQFAAKVGSGGAVKSQLLKIGDVTKVDWVAPTSGTPQPEPGKLVKFAFRADEQIGLVVEATGLKGFACTFTIQRRVVGTRGKVSFEEVDKIKDVPLRNGSATTRWSPGHGQGGLGLQYVFDVTLSKDGNEYRPRDSRSSIAESIYELELKDVGTQEDVIQKGRDPKLNIAWIQPHGGSGDGPMMPKLEARLLGLSNQTQVQWKMDVTFKRPRKRGRLPMDHIQLPAGGSYITLPANRPWAIHDLYAQLTWEQGFFGGDAVISFKVGETSPQSVSFRILGKNPDNAKAKLFISQVAGSSLWFAYAIAKHEVSVYGNSGESYVQFQGSQGRNKARIPGEPVWGLGDSRGPGGVGMFQVTGLNGDVKTDLPPNQLWNWQENVRNGIAILAQKQGAAIDYMTAQRTRMSQDRAKKKLPPIAPPVLQYGSVTFRDGGSATMEDASSIRRFNGGIFCRWRNGQWVLNEYSNTKVKNNGSTVIRQIYYVREVCLLYEEVRA